MSTQWHSGKAAQLIAPLMAALLASGHQFTTTEEIEAQRYAAPRTEPEPEGPSAADIERLRLAQEKRDRKNARRAARSSA